MSKVSVVIPVYGAEKYIERCIRTLFEQTLDSIEYIIVNDCTPDRSIEIMQRVLEEYPHRQEQVRIITHEHNQGVGIARSHGIEACTGEYIIHCDPDDWVDLNMYETMYLKAKEKDADMVYCSSHIHFNGNIKGKNYYIAKASNDKLDIFADFLWNSALWNKMVKRGIAADKTMEMPLNVNYGEDLLLLIQMFLRCQKIIYIDTVNYHYNVISSSITQCRSNISKKIENQLTVEAFLFKIVPEAYQDVLSSFSDEITLNMLNSPDFAADFKQRAALRKSHILKRKKTPHILKLIFRGACCNFTIASTLYRFLKCIQNSICKFREK